MSYYTDGITVSGVEQQDESLSIAVRTSHIGKALQCYVAGELFSVQHLEADSAEFLLPLHAGDQGIDIIAVDPEYAEIDCFEEALPEREAAGNRIIVTIPREPGQKSKDKWRVYIADVKVAEGFVYPRGQEATGFGYAFGSGFGLDVGLAPGFGYGLFGRYFGVDRGFNRWKSPPKVRGSYTVKTSIVDEIGNESTKAETVVNLNTYPREITGLQIDSFASGTLTLSFTTSEDL